MADTSRSNLTWRAIGGLLLFILGVVSFNAAIITSYTALFVLSWVLIFGGIGGFIVSFAIPNAGGVVVGIVSAILSFVLGVIMLVNPGASLASLTLLLAMYFVVDGIIRIVISFTAMEEHRGWSIFYGIVALILGVATWRHWPESSFYIFGVFIGIALIIKGISLIATSYAEMQLGHKARYA